MERKHLCIRNTTTYNRTQILWHTHINSKSRCFRYWLRNVSYSRVSTVPHLCIPPMHHGPVARDWTEPFWCRGCMDIAEFSHRVFLETRYHYRQCQLTIDYRATKPSLVASNASCKAASGLFHYLHVQIDKGQLLLDSRWEVDCGLIAGWLICKPTCWVKESHTASKWIHRLRLKRGISWRLKYPRRGVVVNTLQHYFLPIVMYRDYDLLPPGSRWPVEIAVSSYQHDCRTVIQRMIFLKGGEGGTRTNWTLSTSPLVIWTENISQCNSE